MLLEEAFLDLVDPFMFSSVILFEALVITIEAAILYYLMDKNLGRSIAASFCANLLTGMLSVFYLLFPLGVRSSYSTAMLSLLLGLIMNILVETGVLKLFYKSSSPADLVRVSTIANIITYSIVVLNFVLYVR